MIKIDMLSRSGTVRMWTCPKDTLDDAIENIMEKANDLGHGSGRWLVLPAVVDFILNAKVKIYVAG